MAQRISIMPFAIAGAFLIHPQATQESAYTLPHEKPRVHIVTPAIRNLAEPTGLEQFEPAITVGMDYLTSTYSQYNWTQEYITDPVAFDCDSQEENVQFLLARWYYGRRLEDIKALLVFVTPGCFEAFEISQFAAEWDVLFISSLDYEADMNDRQLYPTFLTTAEQTPSPFVLFCGILRMMNWSRIYQLHDLTSTPYYALQAQYLVDSLTTSCQLPVQATRNEFQSTDDDEILGPILHEFNSRSRVLLYFGGPPGLRRILEVASQLNMTHGEHVYLALLPFENSLFGRIADWQPWIKDSQRMIEAFQSVMIVRMVEESRCLTPNVEKLSKKMQTAEYSADRVRNNMPLLTAVNMALELVGIAVNQTYTAEMKSKDSLPSGTVMAESLLNRTFQLPEGDVHMMAGAQTFLRSSSDPWTDLYHWDYEIGGQWFGGSIFPPDIPLCGFDGKTKICQKHSNQDLLLGTVIGCVSILCLTAGAIWKVRGMRSVENSGWWSLDHRELK